MNSAESLRLIKRNLGIRNLEDAAENRSHNGLKENPQRSAAERRLQKGLYSYYRGEFTKALKEFEKANEAALALGDFARFVESCTYVLRILAEREDFMQIARIEEKVFDIFASVQLPAQLRSRATYVLGICSCYEGTRQITAMNRFREAIDLAVEANDKEALAAPLYGAATVHYARQNYDEALRELARLDILLGCLHLPDLSAAAGLLKSMIYRKQGQVDAALKEAWAAYDSLKISPQLVLYPHILCVLGTLHSMKGDRAAAHLYLNLADRSLKREEFPRIARLVDEALASIGTSRIETMDLVFDTRTGLLTERIKGEIRFEGQFILRDLLRIFLENPGRVFTKEELARLVWRETYVPHVHDNKIYVTIKRLRKLLECEQAQTEYILRAKAGYFLNPKARVLIDDRKVPLTSVAPTGAKTGPEEKKECFTE